MHKKELRALKRINATPKMMKLAAENDLKEPIVYKSSYKNYDIEKKTRYDMFLRCQSRKGILMIAVFFPDMMQKGIKEPLYEIYCNIEGNEYITRVQMPGQTERWKEAMFENLGKIYADTVIREQWRWRNKDIDARIWQNPEGRKEIQSYLKTKEKGWRGIREWQKRAKDKRTKELEERQQKPWDADMALVPKELPGFRKWTSRAGTDQHFIFYDYTKGGAKHGYCDYCEKKVPITRPIHNKEGICNCCGKKIKYKVSTKIQTLRKDDYRTECIQRIKGGIVIRSFDTKVWYRDRKPENPHVLTHEAIRRVILDDGTIRNYEWGLYKNRFHRWIPQKDNGDYYNRGYGLHGKLYTRNMGSLKKTALKNSTIDLWKELPVEETTYLIVEKQSPAIEKLVKIGMFEMAKNIIQFPHICDYLLDRKASELNRMLKIDRSRLKRLRRMNGGMNALRWFQYEKTVDRIWPDEMIKDFLEAGFKDSAAFGFLDPPMHFVKIWNYLKKQSEMSGGSIRQVNNTWNDYINMATKAKWNVKAEQIYKPKNLKEAHMKVFEVLNGREMEEQAEKLEKKWPKVNGILPGIKKFEHTGEQFQIVTPNSILDIVKEGTALSHCVHTCDFYFDRIQKHESYLFFLRKNTAPDVPWYTLEVEPSGNIRQKRTTGDNQNEDFQTAIEYLKEWQQVLKSRLTKEEKELGILADKARIKEYKKLRKDGNKIWHGKLAGKLLVDVLEQDFMEAM